MNKKHQILVCSTCASIWQDGQRIGISGGQKLLTELQQNFNNWEHSSQYELNAVECMSACSNSCVIAFNSPGKYTYIFGDLPSENSSASVLECASKYYAKDNGLLTWQERPELLKKGIIARIPPLA